MPSYYLCCSNVLPNKGASWKVLTGRRDGRVSLASETANFPASRDSIELQKLRFPDKGLNDQDLVSLVGTDYNFNTTTGNGIDPAFLPQLQALCPQTVMQLDQKLWEDASTRNYVQRFLGIRGLQALDFNVEFGRSMVKMSNIGVKIGTESEIRRVCSAIN
ncbi:Cationic peroxidase 2 [Vitis vinifera]|uniref:peroxidase n=1 Tax=Vitis vinifera TaxID=29760 RepID=A0A438CLX9_VITVI|nr:Cationic peroxidase 2 [Vitis vinifera]